jgi:hypothetical protein
MKKGIMIARLLICVLLPCSSLSAQIPTVRDGRQIGFAPTVVRFPNLAPVSPSTWGSADGSATVTTGQAAPDGTTGAARLTSASLNVDYRRIVATSRSFAIGDWLIVGVWVKRGSGSTGYFRNWPAVTISINDAGYRLSGTPAATNARQMTSTVTADTAWEWLALAAKVIAIGTSPAELRLELNCDANRQAVFYAPTLHHIAAGQLSDNEAELLRLNLFPVPDGVAAGTVAKLPAQSSSLGGAGGAVDSVFGRTGTVVAQANDYTWAQIDKTVSSLADLTTRSAADLSSGTLPDGRFPATLPAISGVNLTNLNANNLASGTVPLGRLSGITGSQLSATAAIANNQLANSTITVAGTTNQVNVSGSPVSLGGTVTLSLPQSIHTGATPQFARLGIGGAAGATHLLTIAGGTVTTSTRLLDLTQTWNSALIPFTAQFLNVTDTASAANSLLADWRVGGASMFSVDKAGNMVTARNIQVGNHIVAGGNQPSLSAGAGAGTGPTLNLLAGTDVAGVFVVVAGTSPTPDETIVTLTYASAYNGIPYPLVLPANANAANLLATGKVIYASDTDSSNSAGVIKIKGGALAAGIEYLFYYHISE